jgi:tRNA (cmo5U34)-methyltransferase
LIALRTEQGITDDEFYHYDTPLTVKHDIEALLEAGFSNVEVLNHWRARYTVKAVK